MDSLRTQLKWRPGWILLTSDISSSQKGKKELHARIKYHRNQWVETKVRKYMLMYMWGKVGNVSNVNGFKSPLML